MSTVFERRMRNWLHKRGWHLRKVPAAERFYEEEAYAGFPAATVAGRRFYNVGAGGFHHRFWTNIDYATAHYAGVQQPGFIGHNLMDLGALPLPDESAVAVYSSHTIEHVSDAAVAKFLTESYRILTRGVIRLTAPDAALDWRAYHAGDAAFWYWRHEAFFNGSNAPTITPMRDASLDQLLLLHLFTQLSPLCKDVSARRRFDDEEVRTVLHSMPMAEAFDYFAGHCRFNDEYPGNHISWWTAEKAVGYLKAAGFEDIYVSAYGQSACPPMRNTQFFDNTMPKISFYIEAVKH